MVHNKKEKKKKNQCPTCMKRKYLAHKTPGASVIKITFVNLITLGLGLLLNWTKVPHRTYLLNSGNLINLEQSFDLYCDRWSNQLLIDFFNLNLSSASSSWQNWFQPLRNSLKSLNVIENYWKYIEIDGKRWKKSKYSDFLI